MDSDKFLMVRETVSNYGTETKVDIVNNAEVTVNPYSPL